MSVGGAGVWVGVYVGVLVGMTGVDRQFAEKRLLTILKTEIQNFRLGVAQFPDDGTDLGALIELARPSRAT